MGADQSRPDDQDGQNWQNSNSANAASSNNSNNNATSNSISEPMGNNFVQSLSSTHRQAGRQQTAQLLQSQPVLTSSSSNFAAALSTATVASMSGNGAVGPVQSRTLPHHFARPPPAHYQQHHQHQLAQAVAGAAQIPPRQVPHQHHTPARLPHHHVENSTANNNNTLQFIKHHRMSERLPAHQHATPGQVATAAAATAPTAAAAATLQDSNSGRRDRDPDPYRYRIDRRQSDKPRIQLIQQKHEHSGAGARQKNEVYHPQVEAISPAPEENLADQRLQKEKTEVGYRLISIENDIKSVQDQLLAKTAERDKLLSRVRQSETEEGRRREDEELEQRLVNPFAAIVAENRRKAAQSHRKVWPEPVPDPPYYNQPSDVAAIRDQELRHREFKPRLIRHLRRIRLANERRERHLRDSYNNLQRHWTRRLERLANSGKQKQREAKWRDYFERYFPELRKSRDEKEKIERFYAQPAQTARTEGEVADMMELIKRAKEEEERMKSLAVLPPMLLAPWDIARRYVNTQGLLLTDPSQHWSSHQDLSFKWTEAERQIFREKFLVFGKNFSAISAYLHGKSVSECVQFYYLTKKKEGYKILFKKQNIRRRANKGAAAAAAA
uniref:SANT domain-containing protein n=1 Tax=Macrostomum lignano TaxID=282301 RepID=A0A1I8H0P0_9PLAT